MRDRGYFTFQRVKCDLCHEAESSPTAVSLSPLQQSFSETDENWTVGSRGWFEVSLTRLWPVPVQSSVRVWIWITKLWETNRSAPRPRPHQAGSICRPTEMRRARPDTQGTCWQYLDTGDLSLNIWHTQVFLSGPLARVLDPKCIVYEWLMASGRGRD